MEEAGQLTPEEFWAQVAEGERQVRESAARQPVYGLASGPIPAMVGEWAPQGGCRALVYGEPDAWRHEDVVLSGLEEPRVTVRTGDHNARLGVSSLMRDSGAVPHGAPAVENPAPDEIVELVVDSTPVLFELWRRQRRWWAGGCYHGESIALEGAGIGVGECRLVRVHDIEPFLVERREWIARLREESLPR